MTLVTDQKVGAGREYEVTAPHVSILLFVKLVISRTASNTYIINKDDVSERGIKSSAPHGVRKLNVPRDARYICPISKYYSEASCLVATDSMFVSVPKVILSAALLRRSRTTHRVSATRLFPPTRVLAMSQPPRSLQVGVLIQPDYVFNPGAPVSRDLCTLYYDQPYLRDIDVRRVFVVDETTKTILLTTPMRVMSAWWARHRSMQSAIESGTASASDPIPAPYLAVRGWQPAIDPVVAATYFDTLRAGHAGSFVSAAGIAGINAVGPPTHFTSAPATGGNATAADNGHSVRKVLQGILVGETSWLSLVVDFLSGVEAGASFIADAIDFDVPASLAQEGKVTLLLREEETDVAMGSPMFIADGASDIVEGIQFRGGYGAKWDATATCIPLQKPLYSPTQRGPAENRIWVLGGSTST